MPSNRTFIIREGGKKAKSQRNPCGEINSVSTENNFMPSQSPEVAATQGQNGKKNKNKNTMPVECPTPG